MLEALEFIVKKTIQSTHFDAGPGTKRMRQEDICSTPRQMRKLSSCLTTFVGVGCILCKQLSLRAHIPITLSLIPFLVELQLFLTILRYGRSDLLRRDLDFTGRYTIQCHYSQDLIYLDVNHFQPNVLPHVSIMN